MKRFAMVYSAIFCLSTMAGCAFHNAPEAPDKTQFTDESADILRSRARILQEKIDALTVQYDALGEQTVLLRRDAQEYLKKAHELRTHPGLDDRTRAIESRHYEELAETRREQARVYAARAQGTLSARAQCVLEREQLLKQAKALDEPKPLPVSKPLYIVPAE